jgi:hypothetical protein
MTENFSGCKSSKKNPNSGAETDVFTPVSAVEFKFATRQERRLQNPDTDSMPDEKTNFGFAQ